MNAPPSAAPPQPDPAGVATARPDTASRAPGFFEIDRVGADIDPGTFERDYFRPERPVVIAGAGRAWPALRKWNIGYLRERLSGEPSLKHIVLFLLLDRDALADDFAYPEFVARLNDPATVFPYRSNTRIWINSRNNVSAWHFDTGVVNNFNTQIVGRKEWTLISPQTPPDCYPFSNFVILEDDDKVLHGRRHTRFVTEPGDMLYLLPLWYHSVKALDETNINLMWVFTKRRAGVSSPALVRDAHRYRMHWYCTRHRWPVVRDGYARLMSRLPGYLKITWHFDRLIETDIRHTRWSAAAWFLKELRLLGKTLATLPRIRRQISVSERAPRLGGGAQPRPARPGSAAETPHPGRD